MVGITPNYLFVLLLVGGVLLAFFVIRMIYSDLLELFLQHKRVFLSLPLLIIFLGLLAWLGFERIFAFIPAGSQAIGINRKIITENYPWKFFARVFPGLGREFMPALNEGSFLWMPTTMPHASIGEIKEVLQYQDRAIASIPEVDGVYGKLGRVESALDPAPLSMIETVIHYKSEYTSDQDGRILRFKFDSRADEFVRDQQGQLIPDRGGRPYRQWRDHIRSPQDIWDQIVAAAELPGVTSAPRLQPIETRLVMLQTGMRAPMGIKLRAPDLETLDQMALRLEEHLRQVPEISSGTVSAERVIGKPYLEIRIDRKAIARHGISVTAAQQALSTALGGQRITTTIEGRERYPVVLRYPRELRDLPDQIMKVLIPTATGAQIPLEQVADLEYVRGPQMIRSEDTFLTAYITFGASPGVAEVDVVEAARGYLDNVVEKGELTIPAGVSYVFDGTYRHQLRATQTLMIVVPISLVLIFLLLYLQFRAASTAILVFSGVAVAWAGGFIMLWFYGQPWFLNYDLFAVNLRDLFQLQQINLSVAVWVGFLALFGIAVDDGIVMATYLKEQFALQKPQTIQGIRRVTIEAGLMRVRPCLMTSATTILALLPVLTATGKGADLMIPMALPTVGGMSFVLISMFVVPVLYCAVEEHRLNGG